jgi:hypothetical protein
LVSAVLGARFRSEEIVFGASKYWNQMLRGSSAENVGIYFTFKESVKLCAGDGGESNSRQEYYRLK